MAFVWYDFNCTWLYVCVCGGGCLYLSRQLRETLLAGAWRGWISVTILSIFVRIVIKSQYFSKHCYHGSSVFWELGPRSQSFFEDCYHVLNPNYTENIWFLRIATISQWTATILKRQLRVSLSWRLRYICVCACAGICTSVVRWEIFSAGGDVAESIRHISGGV